MLTFRSIKFQFESSGHLGPIRGVIVGYMGHSCKNKKKSFQNDLMTYEWKQTLSLPLYYNQPIKIIFEGVHLKDTLQAKIILPNYKKGIIDIKAHTQDLKEVANVHLRYEVINDLLFGNINKIRERSKQYIPADKQLIMIESVLVHFDSKVEGNSSIVVHCDETNFQTKQHPINFQQILSDEKINLFIPKKLPNQKDEQLQINFQIYLNDILWGRSIIKAYELIGVQFRYKNIEIYETTNNNQFKIGHLILKIKPTYNDSIYSEVKKSKSERNMNPQISNSYRLEKKKIVDKNNMFQRPSIDEKKKLGYYRSNNKLKLFNLGDNNQQKRNTPNLNKLPKLFQ